MKRLIALAWLFITVPALAEPRMTVLLPTTGSMSPQEISDVFRGSAAARAATPGLAIGVITTSLHVSDIALVVLDATQGPLPANREHVLAARQARVPNVLVLITNVDELYEMVGEQDGDEFFALEEEEIRAVLEVYEVGGANTRVYHDSANNQRATATMAGNLQQLTTDLRSMSGSSRQREVLSPARAAEGEIYLLTDLETNYHSVAIDGQRNLELWIGGQSKRAEIFVNGVAQPGDVVGFRYQSESALPASSGSRMMLINDDRIVGIGVVTEITAR